MRALESSLQEFGEFLLKAQLVRPAAAPYVVRWVRRFLSRPASDEPVADQVRRFCDETECTYADWVRRFFNYVAQQHGGSSSPRGVGVGAR